MAFSSYHPEMKKNEENISPYNCNVCVAEVPSCHISSTLCTHIPIVTIYTHIPIVTIYTHIPIVCDLCGHLQRECMWACIK